MQHDNNDNEERLELMHVITAMIPATLDDTFQTYGYVQPENKQSGITEPEQDEEEEDADPCTVKRKLINSELEKVARLMAHYAKKSKRFSLLNIFTKTIITITSMLTALGLFIGVDQSGLNTIVYYVALGSSIIAFLLGGLANIMNFAERAHNNITTYKSLHSLHTYAMYQLVRNHITSIQLDSLLSDMNTRMLLIRDNTEDGMYRPVIEPQH